MCFNVEKCKYMLVGASSRAKRSHLNGITMELTSGGERRSLERTKSERDLGIRVTENFGLVRPSIVSCQQSQRRPRPTQVSTQAMDTRVVQAAVHITCQTAPGILIVSVEPVQKERRRHDRTNPEESNQAGPEPQRRRVRRTTSSASLDNTGAETGARRSHRILQVHQRA